MREKIIEPVRQILQERLASPLLASFSASWCLWNYKFIVILFSANSVERTFQLIHEVAFPDVWTIFSRGFLYPSFAACIYIFLFPYPTRLVYGFTRRRQKELNQLRQAIENETPLTLEESRKIRAELRETERLHKEEVVSLNVEIQDLRAKLNGSSELPVAKLDPKNVDVKPLVTDSQKNILLLLDKSGGEMAPRELIFKSGTSKTEAEFDIGELLQLGLVESRSNINGSLYRFTHAGRGVVIKIKQE